MNVNLNRIQVLHLHLCCIPIILQGPVLSVYDSKLFTLEVYDLDPELNTLSYPLFVYHLGPAKLHLFSDRFIFSIQNASRTMSSQVCA